MRTETLACHRMCIDIKFWVDFRVPQMRTETLACHRMCIDIKFWVDFRVPQKV